MMPIIRSIINNRDTKKDKIIKAPAVDHFCSSSLPPFSISCIYSLGIFNCFIILHQLYQCQCLSSSTLLAMIKAMFSCHCYSCYLWISVIRFKDSQYRCTDYCLIFHIFISNSLRTKKECNVIYNTQTLPINFMILSSPVSSFYSWNRFILTFFCSLVTI